MATKLLTLLAILALGACSHMHPDRDPDRQHVKGWEFNGFVRLVRQDPWSTHWSCYKRLSGFNKALVAITRLDSMIAPIPGVNTIPACAVPYKDGSCKIFWAPAIDPFKTVLAHEFENCENKGYAQVTIKDKNR